MGVQVTRTSTNYFLKPLASSGPNGGKSLAWHGVNSLTLRTRSRHTQIYKAQMAAQSGRWFDMLLSIWKPTGRTSDRITSRSRHMFDMLWYHFQFNHVQYHMMPQFGQNPVPWFVGYNPISNYSGTHNSHNFRLFVLPMPFARNESKNHQNGINISTCLTLLAWFTRVRVRTTLICCYRFKTIFNNSTGLEQT